MIKLSNGHQLEFVAASGSLAFDGRGWPWEWPLRWTGLLDPHLFTVTVKTLLPIEWKGNLRWARPFDVLKFVSREGDLVNPVAAIVRRSLIGGAVNAIGLTGPGIEKWLERDYPVIESKGYKIIVSITGPEGGQGCLEMVKRLDGIPPRLVGRPDNIVGIEFNASCPNTDPTLLQNSDVVVAQCHAIKEATDQPLLLKLSYSQPYCEIAKRVEGIVEAISINTVPWKIVFGDKASPLAKYGGGGVSGPIAKPFIWKMVSELARTASIPIIGAGVWEYEDISRLKSLGASAVHFGTIFFHPWKPTNYIRRWMKEQKEVEHGTKNNPAEF